MPREEKGMDETEYLLSVRDIFDAFWIMSASEMHYVFLMMWFETRKISLALRRYLVLCIPFSTFTVISFFTSFLQECQDSNTKLTKHKSVTSSVKMAHVSMLEEKKIKALKFQNLLMAPVPKIPNCEQSAPLVHWLLTTFEMYWSRESNMEWNPEPKFKKENIAKSSCLPKTSSSHHLSLSLML